MKFEVITTDQAQCQHYMRIASTHLVPSLQSKHLIMVSTEIDAAASGLLELQKQMKADPKGVPPTVLCVLCGLTNAAYQRKDGVFVVPITELKP